MPDWLLRLDELEIPDGVVAGLSAADKGILRGKLLQMPDDRAALFFVGVLAVLALPAVLAVLRALHTLLPQAGQFFAAMWPWTLL